MSDVVRLEREGRVAWVTIDHPPANALNQAVVAGLRAALDQLAADGEVGAAVVTGAGPRFFVAGADIGEFLEGGAEGNHQRIAAGQALTLAMETHRLPLIAAVNGFALGGGLELAMACDLRIASRSARVGQPEIKLGIIPGWGGTQRLPRLVGRGRALELLLAGEPIDAERAWALGLVNRVVDPEELHAEAQRWAEQLAAQAPLAVASIKRAVAAGLDRPLADGLAAELGEFDAVFRTEDAAEGVAAFVGKRPPVWRGR